MNRENIQKVRDHIAALPKKRFSMAAYFGDVLVDDDDGAKWVGTANWDRRKTNREMAEGGCNTCACIAGHTLVALRPNDLLAERIAGPAQRLLWLTTDQADKLFEPNNHDSAFRDAGLTLERVTLSHAVRVLDHLLETGEVDWVSTHRAKKARAGAPQ